MISGKAALKTGPEAALAARELDRDMMVAESEEIASKVSRRMDKPKLPAHRCTLLSLTVLFFW